ncbi:MAG TPA: class F sortase [Actinophytocola sp.]|uniref:class F sortase n=1 Tax=Actinophytocola sp. TaxID=1872138 RepID=UPI002DBCE24F|nr:class F sortase [Actinophytocola sp.]HEU5472339.1 class F sortase [Actinophytocola sp.]
MTTGRLVVVMVAAVAAAVITIVVAVRIDRSATGPSSRATTTSVSTPVAPAVPDSSAAPARVTIPAIGVDAPLVAVGLQPDGAMQTPDFGNAGWYDRGPQPGEPGPAVVVAHVDSKAKGPDVFHRLRELRAGDRVTVHYPDHSTTFAVTAKEQAAKTELPAGRIWNTTGTPVLRLITCGGAFDRAAGSYRDNVIVYADKLVA